MANEWLGDGQHFCACGAELKRKNGKGPWPKQCAECKAKADTTVAGRSQASLESTASQPKAKDFAGVQVYSKTLVVKQPALYLDDTDWHDRNLALVRTEAVAAGLKPTADGQCTSVSGGVSEDLLELHYDIPVETDGEDGSQ